METMDIKCPRCGQSVTSRFYGPCQNCVVELQESMQGHSKQDDTSAQERFEPKMHVTPNAVALKE